MRLFRDSDLEEVQKWFQGHGQSPPRSSALPKVGVIEPGVAAGFIFETDSDLCILDGYVSRPGVGPKARHQAMNDITETLLDYAKELGFGQVLAICKTSSIEKRAARAGLRPIGTYTLFAKEI